MKNMKQILSTILLFTGLSFGQMAVPRLQVDSSNLVTVGNICELVNAVSSLTDGRTIVLRDGDYNVTSFGRLNITASNVTMVGQSGDPTRVTIRGGGFGSGNTNEELICLYRPNFTLAHLTIRDVRANGLKFQVDSCNNTLIHNVRFIDITERSIKIPNVPQRNITIRYSHFEQISPINQNIPNLYDDGNYIAGMDIMATNGLHIHDNTFLNIRGMTGGGRAAIFLWWRTRNILIERNTFIGCDRSISLGNPGGPINDTVNALIRNNFIVAGTDISIEHARVVDSKVYHNTVFRITPNYYRSLFMFESGNIDIRNNIVFGNVREESAIGTSLSGNLFSTSLADSSWFTNWRTGNLRIGLNSLPTRRNLVRLSDVNEDFSGANRSDSTDVGAFEGPFTLPPPPPPDTIPVDTLPPPPPPPDTTGGPQLRACRDR